MKIVALVKYTPELTADPRFAPDLTLDRAAVPGRLSELDEYTAEQAIRLAEAEDSSVTFLTMGPDGALDALRKALAMGGDAGVLVTDPALHGADALATSRVLAAAIERIGFDLVVTGMGSTDAGMGVLAAMLAERLGVAQISYARSVSVEGGEVHIERESDHAVERLAGPLPAVVSVTDRSGEPRYPSFKGIMAAKKKPVETLTLDDLGVTSAPASTTVLAATPRPARQAGEQVPDDGEGGVRLADFLSTRKFL